MYRKPLICRTNHAKGGPRVWAALICGRWTFHPSWKAALREVQRFYQETPLEVPS